MKKLLLLACLLTSITTQAAYVNSTDGLTVREKPTTRSRAMDVLPYGTEVQQVDDEPLEGWIRIRYTDTQDGYVCTDYLSEENPLDSMKLLGTWRITAYAETGYPCANGNYPQKGYTVACNSLPFGTQIYIEGVGVRTVEDRGPSWLGSEWCDLYLGDYNSCIQWGSQYRNVYLLPEEK